MRAISQELVGFLQEGLVGEVATIGADGIPEIAPVMGAKVSADRTTLTLFVPHTLAGGTVANAKERSELAVVFCRVLDERAVQVKGTFLSARDAAAEEQPWLAAQGAKSVERLMAIGMQGPVLRRVVWWPAVALELRVRDVFSQTPGPNAGATVS